VTNPGATTMIGAAQSGLQFENGKTYPIGVTAKADKEREMVILMQLYKPEGPSWTDIFLQRVKLTTAPQTFLFNFTYNDETMAAQPTWEADIYFMLKGPVGRPATVWSPVWIDCPWASKPPLVDSTMDCLCAGRRRRHRPDGTALMERATWSHTGPTSATIWRPCRAAKSRQL
jgi:hypothetical protein